MIELYYMEDDESISQPVNEYFKQLGYKVSIYQTIADTKQACMIKISYLNPMEFIAVAPVFPILMFIVTIFAFVALAYFLSFRNVRKINLAELLKDDTMM